uniref:Secreted protein n=1 Tax=Heterorhabditis bacteriophora TaxID=37862 RepID=A0A1I7W7T9_HETBA
MLTCFVFNLSSSISACLLGLIFIVSATLLKDSLLDVNVRSKYFLYSTSLSSRLCTVISSFAELLLFTHGRCTKTCPDLVKLYLGLFNLEIGQ